MKRSPMPLRAVSLAGGGPLPRYKELGRNTASRAGGFSPAGKGRKSLGSAQLTVVRGDGAPVVQMRQWQQPRRRDTGFSPAVKLAVRKRAGNGDPDDARCEATGVWLGRHGGEIQHRDARGMGGSRLANTIVNAVLLSCEAHRLAEARDERMNAEGFWLRNGEDPALTPILLHSAGGSGITVWLTEVGGYSYEPPGGMAS